MVEKKCYWCENEAVSMEHVPPRCLFPEDKDVKHIFNKTYRENLIPFRHVMNIIYGNRI